MRRNLLFVLYLFYSALFCDEIILKSEEIKTGMKGYALTEIKNKEISKIQIEIKDKVSGDGSIKEMFFAQTLPDSDNKKIEISEGMSGSPVYIEGNLIGAVSYILKNDKTSFLITPIEEMKKIGRFDDSNFPIAEKIDIKPGETIVISPVRGDITIDTVGTVTYVDGNKICALGHPVDNLGTVRYFILRGAAVLDTNRYSADNIYKSSKSFESMGVITQDRKAGVTGFLIKEIKSVKISLETKVKSEIKNTDFEIVSDERIIKSYLGMAVQSAVNRNIDSDGYRTARYSYEIIDEQGVMILKKSNVIFYEESLIENMSDLIGNEIATINSNPFKDVKIKKINIKIGLSENNEIAAIRGVAINKSVVKLGEVIEAGVTYQLPKKVLSKEKIKIQIPDRLKIGTYVLRVLSGQEMQDNEGSYSDFESFISSLRNFPQNNEIYIRVFKKDEDESGENSFVQKVQFPYYAVSQNLFESEFIIDSFEAGK